MTTKSWQQLLSWQQIDLNSICGLTHVKNLIINLWIICMHWFVMHWFCMHWRWVSKSIIWILQHFLLCCSVLNSCYNQGSAQRGKVGDGSPRPGQPNESLEPPDTDIIWRGAWSWHDAQGPEILFRFLPLMAPESFRFQSELTDIRWWLKCHLSILSGKSKVLSQSCRRMDNCSENSETVKRDYAKKFLGDVDKIFIRIFLHFGRQN